MEEKTKSKKHKNSHVLFYAGMVLFGIAIVLAILFWLNGETKTYGNYPEHETNSSLSCKITGFSYPFFTYDNAKKNTTEINAIFDNDKLKVVTLVYTLSYDSADEIEESEAKNHYSMNEQFTKDNLPADAFESKYARLSDALKYSISAEASKVTNGGNAKYFLLSDENGKSYSIDKVKKVYQDKGFKCEQK